MVNDVRNRYFASGNITVNKIGLIYNGAQAWCTEVTNYMKDLYSALGIQTTDYSQNGKTFTYGSKTYTEYKQGDYSDGKVMYNATGSLGTIKQNGCLPTSIAVIATGYGKTSSNGQLYTPETIITEGIQPAISNYSNAKNAFSRLGLKLGTQKKTATSANQEDMMSNLLAGNPILVHASSGYYTGGGHYMVLLGAKQDNGIQSVYLSNVGSKSKTGWVELTTLINRNVDWYAVVTQ